MSDREQLVAVLRNLTGDGLRQEKPYPVVLPRTADEAAKCVRTARDFGFVVLPLGSGSSFAADFTLRRENVLAIASARMSGIERRSPFNVRILSGTSVNAVLSESDSGRRTLGGMICDIQRSNGRMAFTALWRRILRIEFIDAHAEVAVLAGPLGMEVSDHGMSSILAGSRGRIGFITALEIAGTIPIAVYREANTRHDALPNNASENVIGRTDVLKMTDAAGIFQW